MRISFAVAALCIAASAPLARAQTLEWTFTGSVADEYGTAVHVTADQNADGYVDVIVGAPGNNSNRGYIRCVSGKFLATGSGTVTLWSLFPTVNAGARFGTSIIEVATLTGDAATDYVVGAPGFLSPAGSPTGALFLIDGSTHLVATHIFGKNNTRLGTSLAALGDQNGDGKIDIASSAPSTNTTDPSQVHVIRGSSFFVSNSLASVPHGSVNSSGSNVYGAVVASGFDLDQDGKFDLAVGSPGMLGGGFVEVMRADLSFQPISSFVGAFSGERMGSAIDGTQDFNGDGVPDLVVGAPNWSAGLGEQDGRAVVMSGAQLLAHTFPFEIYDLRFATGAATPATYHFGAAVRASPDLNGDGVPDFIVGAPDYFTNFPFLLARGAANVYSGATGTKLGGVFGNSFDNLGNELTRGFLDMNADGFLDFAVAGSFSDNANTNCGNVKYYSLFPTAPGTYCTAKTNSLGCTPSMSWSGSASASSASPFLITGVSVLNQKSGLFFYSHKPNAAVFQGGTLCVKTPTKRTPVLDSGGSATGNDCTGVFSFDFNARIQSGVDATLVVGSEVFAQCWSRDAQSTSGTSVSNGLRFVINP